MAKKVIEYDPGEPLSERQKEDVYEQNVRHWNNVAKPDMLNAIENQIGGSLRTREDVDSLNKGLGKFTFYGVAYYKTTVAANIALVISLILLIISSFKK